MNEFINNHREEVKVELRLLQQEEIQSSYATRNKGIKKSKYDILAFIDSDCHPVENWLKEGIKTMLSKNADLVGGNVKFTFEHKHNLAEIYDSISNAQFETDIKNRGLAKTGNLFIKKEVFKTLGLFPENFISGGDVYFAKKATNNKFRLFYSPNAIVFHPSRTLIPLVKKQIRVGKGKAQIWELNKLNNFEIFVNMVKYLTPPMPFSLARKLSKINSVSKFSYPLVYCVAYICKFSTLAGASWHLLSNKNI